jgi:hypothetical protein
MTLILSGTNGVSDIDGSAATPAIRGTDANTGIFFPAADTFGIATGGTERMRVDSSGNVGIGTTTLNGKLNVLTATDSKLIFNDGSTTGNVRLEAVNNAYSAYKPFETNGSVQIFATGGAERMRIDSSGNVMMGVTSPLSSGKFSISFDGSTRQGQVLRTTIGTTGSTYIQFENSAGSTAGYIIHNGTTTVNYVTSSDYRLKEEITPMTGALAKVAQLKPVTYKWKVDGSDGEGFIAHELAEVCPIAVTRKKDEVDADGNPKYQGVDTSFLVATLTAAIQEQQALITALTARIEALEAK